MAHHSEFHFWPCLFKNIKGFPVMSDSHYTDKKVSSQNTRTFGQCCPRAWPPLLDKKRPACQVYTRCHPICTANQSHWVSADPYITSYITSDVSPYLVFISTFKLNFSPDTLLNGCPPPKVYCLWLNLRQTHILLRV